MYDRSGLYLWEPLLGIVFLRTVAPNGVFFRHISCHHWSHVQVQIQHQFSMMSLDVYSLESGLWWTTSWKLSLILISSVCPICHALSHYWHWCPSWFVAIFSVRAYSSLCSSAQSIIPLRQKVLMVVSILVYTNPTSRKMKQKGLRAAPFRRRRFTPWSVRSYSNSGTFHKNQKIFTILQ